MANLVFLEAATQSEGAETIIESNEKLINFATAEVDSLVEEQALYAAWNVGEFVEDDFSTTYENVTEPVADIVTEATSIFSDIIATEDLTEAEKMDCISSWAHIICMDDIESWEEMSILDKAKAAGAAVGSKAKAAGAAVGSKAKAAGATVGSKAKAGASTKAGHVAIGAIAGGGYGASVGVGIANVGSMFSKERKEWKSLIKQEKQARKKGANAAVLAKLHTAKNKARDAYFGKRHVRAIKGAKVGGVAGAVGGGIAGAKIYNMKQGT